MDKQKLDELFETNLKEFNHDYAQTHNKTQQQMFLNVLEEFVSLEQAKNLRDLIIQLSTARSQINVLTAARQRKNTQLQDWEVEFVINIRQNFSELAGYLFHNYLSLNAEFRMKHSLDNLIDEFFPFEREVATFDGNDLPNDLLYKCHMVIVTVIVAIIGPDAVDEFAKTYNASLEILETLITAKLNLAFGAEPETVYVQ